MKELIFTLVSVITFSMVFAQAPNKMSYQAVVRNSQNALVSNQSVGMRVSILQGTASGSAVYVETHTTTTNNNGLASIEIGGGAPVTSAFSAINWANGPYFVKTETDPTGGTNYSISGTSQLLSVPYALFAGNVANNGGKQTLVLSDDVTDAQAAAIIAAEVGPNTQEIKIIGTTQLTQVDLSMIKTAIEIVVDNNEALTSVNLSGLTRMDGDLDFSDCPLLSDLNLSSLEKVTTGWVNIENTALTNLNLTKLQKMNGGMSIESNSKLNSISFVMTKLSDYLEIRENPILTSISFSNLTTMVDGIEISNNAILSSISFPALITAQNISISQNAALGSVSFPVLTTATVGFSQNAALTSVSCPVLTTSGGISFYINAALTSVSFPVLTTAGSVVISQSAALTSVSFPVLTTSKGISFENNLALSNVSFPVLTMSGGISFYINSALSTISFPVLTALTGSIYLYNNASLNSFSANQLTTVQQFSVNDNPLLSGFVFPALTAITGNNNMVSSSINTTAISVNPFPALTSFGGQYLSMTNNKLTSVAVNSILARLIGISPTLTGKEFSLGSQTPSAPPTGAGLTNKQTLINNGNMVWTD